MCTSILIVLSLFNMWNYSLRCRMKKMTNKTIECLTGLVKHLLISHYFKCYTPNMMTLSPRMNLRIHSVKYVDTLSTLLEGLDNHREDSVILYQIRQRL